MNDRDPHAGRFPPNDGFGQGSGHNPTQPYGPVNYGPPQYGPAGYIPSPYGWPGSSGGGPGIPTGKPPRRGGKAAIAIVAVAVVALIAAVATLGVLAARHAADDDRTAAVASTTTPSPVSPSTTTGPSTGADDEQCPAATPGPNTPAGWRTVAGKRGLLYDVPPDWEVASCGTLVGWEKRCPDGPFGYCPIRTMSGAATLEPAQCPDDTVGLAGLPGASNTSDVTVALRDEAALVKDIYTSDSGRAPQSATFSRPRAFTVGRAQAVQTTAIVTGIETSRCEGPTAVHSIVATTVPGQQGSVLFVISLTEGIAGAADPRIVDAMVSTLRPAPVAA